MSSAAKIGDRQIEICKDKAELADKAARHFAKLVNSIAGEKGQVTVALSGGSTPKALYERLVQADLAQVIPWNKIQFFVSDERCVPHESEESNYGNALRLLLNPMNVASAHAHPTQDQDKDAGVSATTYEIEVRTFVNAGKNGVPAFDIIFLGMGPDGHTASLFPGTAGLEEARRLVIMNHVEKLNSDRVTFTFPLLNSASHVIFLVGGSDKAGVLKEVFANAGKYPCERVQPVQGDVIWFLDEAAAVQLQS